MSEVTVRPPPAAFPRSSSLYMPDLAHSTPSLLGSSYSPFPEFPGSRSDPLNLNRFLSSPDDASWMLHLVPTSDALEPLKAGQPSRGGVKKVRSNSMLHRSSPLSRPPLGGDGIEEENDEQLTTRKRSNSVGSIPSPKSQEIELPEPMPESVVEMKKGSIGRKTIRTAFQFRRKSLLSMSDEVATAEDGCAPTGHSNTPSITSLASDDSVPSTPFSSRSNSTYSEFSSASSASSCDGPQTPNEAVLLVGDAEVASGKLAIALAAAEGAPNKKGGWRGWLGGRRMSKVLSSASSSASVTPASSSESSPTTSVIALDPTPQLSLSVSAETSRPASPLATNIAINKALAMEQTRRISIRKLGQLRAPSPHPLALALRRQYSNLPDEIASSIQSGQKVFPRSVNVISSTPGLNPSQGGMFTSLCVMHVLQRLERGECPDSALTARRASDPMTMPRPNGVRDFVNRPPYEERNLVFFANGTCSPISMARPGYGVWDLDFSPYILALSAVDTVPVTPWPILPRASMGLTDTLVDTLKITGLETPSPGSEPEEVLVSPAPVAVQLVEESTAEVKSIEEPVSSFRSVAVLPQTWQESSDEEEEEEEEDEEDDSPLSSIISSKQVTSNSAIAATVPAITHPRSKSPPAAKRVSIVEYSEAKQRKAMEEVARARERRRANLTGELERQAEAEMRRSRVSSNRHSTAVDEGQIRRTSGRSSSTPALQEALPEKESARDSRRRTQSSYDLLKSRPSTSRTTSAPAGLMGSKRYHSFYELPKSHPSPVKPPPSVAPQMPQVAHLSSQAYMPQMYPGYGHPVMQGYPGIPHPASMVFPSGYMPPMGMPAMHQQPMIAIMPQPVSPPFLPHQSPPMYLQMQGRGNRSSLSVPDARQQGSNRHGGSRARQSPAGSLETTGRSY